jgi:uncharacterized membrane protein YeaQ/YmgE (transglycosylase-associated protein family)
MLGVFPVPNIVVVIVLISFAIAGMAIGALTGWVSSSLARRAPRGVFRDSVLGLVGFLVGYYGCLFMPWPRNTVVERLDGGGSVATTMNTYQHPERVAVVMSILLPLLHQLYQFRRARTETPTPQDRHPL